ncbi:MAG TPA: PH domain-containing protein [Patescibacteria group bacterium]|nr:PH domain-containing protein [Patescibacteria group bacterium]
MGSYINGTLLGDERVICESKISMWSLLPLFLLGLILLPVYGLGLLFWISAILRYISTELAVTNKRVIAKFGFIRRNTIEMHLAKVESIQVHQGVIGRLFGFGSLIVSGAGNPQAPIPGVANPMEFRRRAMEAQAV